MSDDENLPAVAYGDGVLSYAERLEDLTGKALDEAGKILDMDLQPDAENFARLVAAKTATIRTVIGAAIRVNEHGLRRRTQDTLGKLLEKLRQEDRAKVIDPVAERADL